MDGVWIKNGREKTIIKAIGTRIISKETTRKTKTYVGEILRWTLER
jgi:hypothetical protein